MFKTPKLRKECNDFKLLQRRQGPKRARLIRRRLDDIDAAETLSELHPPHPARCHELKGKRKGQLAIDLDHPFRLIIEPAPPKAKKSDGGLDWQKTTAIVVIGVEDYHG